jgi:hypothetical protein
VSASEYSLGFTTGAALIRESVLVAGLYVQLGNWSDVRSRVLAENTFQSRTESTLKKLCGEVLRRLKLLTDAQLVLVATGSEARVRALVWLAICRQYKFIYDLTLEVIVPHYDAARFLLGHEDYDAFFNAKADWHDNLNAASTQTKSKARQVFFKMIKECGLIGDNNDLQPQQLDEQLRQLIAASEPDDLRLYPGVG